MTKQKEVSEEEAKQILLRRFLKAYGPATPQGFSKWTGMSMKEVKAAWQLLEEELVEVHVEDRAAYIGGEDCRQLAERDPGNQTLRLLPSFDPYMLGHVDNSYLVDHDFYKRIYRKQGWISPVVLLNGRVISTWSFVPRGKRSPLKIEPFKKLSRIIRSKIEEEAAGLGDFLGIPLVTEFLGRTTVFTSKS